MRCMWQRICCLDLRLTIQLELGDTTSHFWVPCFIVPVKMRRGAKCYVFNSATLFRIYTKFCLTHPVHKLCSGANQIHKLYLGDSHGFAIRIAHCTASSNYIVSHDGVWNQHSEKCFYWKFESWVWLPVFKWSASGKSVVSYLLLPNSRIQYHRHSCPLLDHILSLLYTIAILTPYIPKIFSDIFLTSTLWSPE
jgi:hypothetical protein